MWSKRRAQSKTPVTTVPGSAGAAQVWTTAPFFSWTPVTAISPPAVFKTPWSAGWPPPSG